ncbi:MAG: PEP-CTERM sorting domain-containing protein [Gemmatimonadetes bacterium]|nr:PEP-CTERM sorting domain-containing protein [Gemmatimonadota bacterium]
MKRLSSLVAAAVIGVSLATAPTTASAQAANEFITFGGLDWAWASPCSSGIPGSCGSDIVFFGGWRYATQQEWTGRPQASDFLDPSGNHFGTGGQMRCAAHLFGSGYSHCDFFNNTVNSSQDPNWVMSGPGVGVQSGYAETWVVRGNSNVVPEPSTYALMAAGLAGVFGVARRRRQR